MNKPYKNVNFTHGIIKESVWGGLLEDFSIVYLNGITFMNCDLKWTPKQCIQHAKNNLKNEPLDVHERLAFEVD